MEPNNMGETDGAWYKNKLVVGVIVVVVILVGFLLFRGGGNKTTTEIVTDENKAEVVSKAEPKAGEIAVVGKLGCTPLKSGATPTKDECILGLVGDDGKFYAFDTSKIEAADNGIVTDSSIRVIGIFSPVDLASDESGSFKYDGVMMVRLMVLNK
ncbi:MAG: hypothetical protein AAB660_00620 [Patescibacteria group bacterium]